MGDGDYAADVYEGEERGMLHSWEETDLDHTSGSMNRQEMMVEWHREAAFVGSVIIVLDWSHTRIKRIQERRCIRAGSAVDDVLA